MPSLPENAEVISISSDSEQEEQQSGSRRGPAYAQHALDGASRAQLRVAIATGPEDRVRDAFEVLVGSLPVVPEQVFRMLVAIQSHHVEEISEDEDEEEEEEEDEEGDGQSIKARRVELVPRWQICRSCQEEFDAGTPRVHGECTFHSGECESGCSWSRTTIEVL